MTQVSSRRLARTLSAVAVLAVAAGCAAPRPASPVAAGHAARAGTAQAGTARAAAIRVATRSQARGAAAGCDPEAASLAPQGPPSVPPGSFMAKILARGYLVAGVDQSTYHFGYLNPLNGQIEGFDIDMIKAVAQAIFGAPGHVHFKAISDAQRIKDVQDGTVDIVAHTMTITCDRLKHVDFSSVYFEAHQKVLVPTNSSATGGLADLFGAKICATTGSDSAANIAAFSANGHTMTAADVVTVPYWTDCLRMLQQGQVAAVSTDDSILYGLQAQDPFTMVVGPALTNEPYGLAISKQHPEFVRFVNAVLAQERASGAWVTSYKRWLSTPGTPVPQPPAAKYAG